MSATNDLSPKGAAQRSLILAFAANGGKSTQKYMDAPIFMTNGTLDAVAGSGSIFSAEEICDRALGADELKFVPPADPRELVKSRTPENFIVLTETGRQNAVAYEQMAREEMRLLHIANTGSRITHRAEPVAGATPALNEQAVTARDAFDRLVALNHLKPGVVSFTNQHEGKINYAITGEITKAGEQRLEALQRLFPAKSLVAA